MSWIEVVDGLGRVVARRTAVGVPCTIGSAADNTLVGRGLRRARRIMPGSIGKRMEA